MTIGTGWAAVLKEGAPGAFSRACPRAPTTCFIDGQIKLNKSEHIRSWHDFLHICFYKPIRFSFDNGTARVVLAFDNYDKVPAAKGMTQAKRNKQVVRFEFAQGDALPATPPPDWGACMRNRVFKSKVITMILNNLRQHFADIDPERHTLVLDHQRIESIGAPWPLLDALGAENSNGESDCKAYDYVEDHVPCLIDSVDGDMLVLSLLHQRRHPHADIIVRRIATKTAEDRKRKRTSGREYEFVSIPDITQFLERTVVLRPDPVTAFAALVAMCGCDFSRNLPRIGEAKLWQMRNVVRHCDLSQPDGILDALARLYAEVFKRNVAFAPAAGTLALEAPADAGPRARYADVHARIQRTAKISPKIREALWAPETAECHARNVRWTLAYWTERSNAPFPIADEHGYAYGKNRVPQFAK